MTATPLCRHPRRPGWSRRFGRRFSPRSGRLRLAHAFVAAAALAAFGQAWTSLSDKSLTFDEVVYIPAGYSYVTTGDYRLNPEHPPLAKLLAGVALIGAGPALDTTDVAWQSPDQWAVGLNFFDSLGPDTPRVVNRARVSSVLLLMLVVALAYAMGAALYGAPAGMLAAWLAAFSPNLLAHGRLVTTEIGLACFVLATALAVLRMKQRPSAGRIAVVGLVLGLALLTKYSAILLVGLVPFWVTVSLFQREDGELPGWLSFERLPFERLSSSIVRRPVGWIAATGLAGILAAFVVSLGYQAPGRFDIYVRNLGVLYSNVNLGLPPYFAGTFHEGGLWYYFLATFLLKTPLAFLVLLGLRFVDQWLRRDAEVRSLAYLVVPAAGWLLAMTLTALPLGVRYLLPMYPLLFVFVGGLLGTPRFSAGRGRAVVVGLALLFAAASLRVRPDYLPYVNVLAELRGEPIEWLDDSNVDWGQDLPLLAEYLREREITDATIVPMAWYDPALYGVPGTVRSPAEVLPLLTSPDPPPGVYAVSAHLLTRTRWVAPPQITPPQVTPPQATPPQATPPQATPPEIDPLRDLTPVAILGHSIFVFEFPGS